MFSGYLSLIHIFILLHLPFHCTSSLHRLQGSSPSTFVLNFKSLCVLIGGFGDYWAGGGFAVCVPVRPLPVQWPTAGATAGPLPASQPAASAIGSLELIHPAEPCKAPFVPSCRLDQAGDRHSSLDWLSVSQPMAIHIQAQAQARPSHHQIKGGRMGAGGLVGGEWSEIVSPEFRHSLNTVERWSDEEKNKQEEGILKRRISTGALPLGEQSRISTRPLSGS